jgi:hypothetical protein
MDILKLISSGLESTWANKNFIALVVIAFQLRSQKLIFNGMFKVQDVKIKHIDEKAEEAKKESSEAKKESSEAIKSVVSIKPKVDKIYDWFTEEKWKTKTEVENAKEETS